MVIPLERFSICHKWRWLGLGNFPAGFTENIKKKEEICDIRHLRLAGRFQQRWQIWRDMRSHLFHLTTKDMVYVWKELQACIFRCLNQNWKLPFFFYEYDDFTVLWWFQYTFGWSAEGCFCLKDSILKGVCFFVFFIYCISLFLSL